MTACSENCQKHIYANKKNLEIYFEDYPGDGTKDKFSLIEGHNDWNEAGAHIVIIGNLNKDSVNTAVERYYNTGQYPSEADLQ